MATGTTSDATLTRTNLICLALSMIGVSEPDNTDQALGVQLLSVLTRHLDARGTWLWTMSSEPSTLNTVSGQSAYTAYNPPLISPPGQLPTEINNDILKLEHAETKDGSQIRQQLIILDKQSSFRTYYKDDLSSEPLAVHLQTSVDRKLNKLIVYPTPNASYTIDYYYRKPLFDFDSASDNPDFPQDFFLPLVKLLASELCPHYGKPLQERQLLKAEGERDFEISKNLHVSDPTYETLKTRYY